MSEIEERLAEVRGRLRDIPDERAATEEFERLAEETVTGTSHDGAVTVFANGHGTIDRIEFAPTALRGHDNHSLAEKVAEAVNQAFDAAQRLQQSREPVDRAGFERDLDDIVDGFGERMEGLVARLDDVLRDLQGDASRPAAAPSPVSEPGEGSGVPPAR